MDSYGGGICSRGGQNNFEDLIIKDNSASNGGGGIFCFGSTDTLRNIIFSNNTGSSVTAWNQIYVENCLFESENDPSYALDFAGGSGQSYTIMNTTIANYDYGITIQDNELYILNSVIWTEGEHAISLGGNSSNNDSTVAYVRHSLIRGAQDNVSVDDPNNETRISWFDNLNTSPVFVDSAEWRLPPV